MQVNGAAVSDKDVVFDAVQGVAYVLVDSDTLAVTFDGSPGEFSVVLGNLPKSVINGQSGGGNPTNPSSGKGLFGAPILQVAGQPVDVGSALAGVLVNKLIG